MGDRPHVLTIEMDREFVGRGRFPDEIVLRHIGKGGGLEVEQRFTLVPTQALQVEESGMDLDRMCDAAMERLRAGIASSTRKAHEEWAKECYARACRAAITKEVEKYVRSLAFGQMFADCMGIGGIARTSSIKNKTMEQK